MFHWWILEALEHMAGFLVDAAAKVGHHGHDSACDDDFYDRISRRYSVILLIIFTILVSTKQYVGEPIACFCPAHFTGTHVEYTNNICWISNTYFVSFDRLLPKYPDPKTERFIYFYQYVPFILIFQAILFYIPSLIWTSLNSKSGYDLGMLVTQTRIIDTYSSDLRENAVRYLARYIDRTLEYHRHKRSEYIDHLRSIKCSSFLSFCIQYNHMTMHENHLMWSFLFTKILYLLNACGQLYLLNFFLGNDYHMYGFTVIRALFSGNNENWTVTSRFPRVTWCNFAVRNLADNIHTYTVQCNLPINLFNEKIFLIIWFWLYFTTIFTFIGFIYWISSLLYPDFYKSNIIRYLSSKKRINIHHFPQNPFEEQIHYRHHPHFHFGSMHGMHHYHHHHNFLSPFSHRTLRTNTDRSHYAHLHDQIHISVPFTRDRFESDSASKLEEQTLPEAKQRRTSTPAEKKSLSISNENNSLITEFLKNYLGRDGTLVLYILRINTNEIITGEIVGALFELFKMNYRTNPKA